MGCFLFLLNGVIWFFIAIFVYSKNINLAGGIFWAGVLGVPFLFACLIDIYNDFKRKEEGRKSKLTFYRHKLIKYSTLSERIFEEILKKNNIEYVFQKDFNIGDKLFIVDFYLPQLKICIEIDGPYHEQNTRKEADEIRESWIKREHNTKFLRFKNNEIRINNEDKIIREIRNIEQN